MLQHYIGPKPINRITVRDIAHFLDLSNTRSTHKRRLTSLGSFFDFLVKRSKVLTVDPSDGFYPEHIPGRGERLHPLGNEIIGGLAMLALDMQGTRP